MKPSTWLVAVVLSGCSFFQQKVEEQERPLARVQDSYLYPSDVATVMPEFRNPQDSAMVVDKFINDWVRKQLMIEQAKEATTFNEAEIQRKVLDYRYALMRSAYEKEFVEKNLNETVTEKDISDYYNEKADDFILKQNILRGLFAKFPKEAPGLGRFRTQLYNYPTSSLQELRDYCNQFANRAFMEDSIWLNFEEVVAQTPFEGLMNKEQVLRNKRLLENSDDDFVYLLRIVEYKVVDEISPLEFVKEDIQNIILNKRKMSLKIELQSRIYEDAKKNGMFEIYTD